MSLQLQVVQLKKSKNSKDWLGTFCISHNSTKMDIYLRLTENDEFLVGWSDGGKGFPVELFFKDVPVLLNEALNKAKKIIKELDSAK